MVMVNHIKTMGKLETAVKNMADGLRIVFAGRAGMEEAL